MSCWNIILNALFSWNMYSHCQVHTKLQFQDKLVAILFSSLSRASVGCLGSNWRERESECRSERKSDCDGECESDSAIQCEYKTECESESEKECGSECEAKCERKRESVSAIMQTLELKCDFVSMRMWTGMRVRLITLLTSQTSELCNTSFRAKLLEFHVKCSERHLLASSSALIMLSGKSGRN